MPREAKDNDLYYNPKTFREDRHMGAADRDWSNEARRERERNHEPSWGNTTAKNQIAIPANAKFTTGQLFCYCSFISLAIFSATMVVIVVQPELLSQPFHIAQELVDWVGAIISRFSNH